MYKVTAIWPENDTIELFNDIEQVNIFVAGLVGKARALNRPVPTILIRPLS